MNSTEACLVRIQQSGHDMNRPSFRWSCRVQRSKSIDNRGRKQYFGDPSSFGSSGIQAQRNLTQVGLRHKTFSQMKLCSCHIPKRKNAKCKPVVY